MNQSSSEHLQNQIKIGHYILGETLGTGSFGKVKSNYFKFMTPHLFVKFSGFF